MTTPELEAFRAAVLANTLTPEQQEALVNAIDDAAPFVNLPIVEGDPRAQFAWSSGLYAIAGGLGGAAVGSFAAVISVANAAALTAFDVTTFPDGSRAYTATFGQALWVLGPHQTANGRTVLDASDGRSWMRVGPANPEAAALQVAWDIDPAGSLTTTSDENDGLTPSTALATKAEVMRRLGSWAPTYDGNVTPHVVVTYLSADSAAGTDPGLFAPVLLNGAIFEEVAALPAPSFHGTLLAFTTKTTATNTMYASTFTTTSGAVAARMLLVNTTRANSRATAYRDQGGGNWLLTRPLEAFDPTAGKSATADDWANGDSILGYALVAIDLARIGGQIVEYDDASGSFGHVVHQMQILDPVGAENEDPLVVEGNAYPALVDVDCQRSLAWQAAGIAFGGFAQNGLFDGPAIWDADIGGLTQVSGGVVGSTAPIGVVNTARGVSFVDDVILGHNTVCEDCAFAEVYLDAGAKLILNGLNQVIVALFGPGAVSVNSGTLQYNNTAALALPQSGGKDIGSATNAYSYKTTAGVVAVNQVTGLTSTLLDAAAGATGYGGLAAIPSVGSFWRVGVVP